MCTRGISYRGRERGLLTCYPDTDLAIAKKLMEAKGIKQLPVVKRGGGFQRERRRRIGAILYYDSILYCLRLKSQSFLPLGYYILCLCHSEYMEFPFHSFFPSCKKQYFKAMLMNFLSFFFLYVHAGRR